MTQPWKGGSDEPRPTGGGPTGGWLNRPWKGGSDEPRPTRSRGTRSRPGGRRRVSSSQVGLMLLIVGGVFAVLAPRFLSPGNLLNVCTSASVVAIVGLGMTLAIASGNFDLSVGSTAAFAGCVTMSLVQQIGVAPAIFAGLATGAAVGLINGLIVTELRVPAFIATLGMLTIVRGAALIYTGGRDIYLYGQTQYKILSSGPTPVLLALALAAVLWFVLQHTRFGRHILATGSNAASAQRVGVRTSLVLLGVFSIVGATAALSGLVLSAQVLTGNGRLATGLELSAIAVVVLGGTPLTGGKASITGTLQGSVLVAVINNGLNLLNVSIFYQNVTLGLLLLGALALEAGHHRSIYLNPELAATAERRPRGNP
jgi:ribose/xylose/arabinose/galactoside ABC-type transport system permease subunit